MDKHDTELFLEGFQFTEGVRWHNNTLWFCDLWGNQVYCFSEQGKCIQEISVNTPVGLGWLLDDSLLITSLKERTLFIFKNNELSVYHMLDMAAPGYCHDFTVSQKNIVYLSTSGFYPQHKIKPIKSKILVLTEKGNIKIAASNMGYPNGIIITPDQKHLIVSETFAATVSIFDITSDHTLTNQKPWAKFDDLGFQVSFDKHGIPEDRNRHYPDGICYDEQLQAVWIASPGKKEVLCVDGNNKCLKIIKTQYPPFDCALGGTTKRTLFIATSDVSKKTKSGKIETVSV